MQKRSPSGKYIIRLVSEAASDKKQHFVEIWKNQRMVSQMQVSDFHDAFYTDGK